MVSVAATIVVASCLFFDPWWIFSRARIHGRRFLLAANWFRLGWPMHLALVATSTVPRSTANRLYPRVQDIGAATPALGIVANTPPRNFPIEDLVSSTFTRRA
jgi:hypothetical protein